MKPRALLTIVAAAGHRVLAPDLIEGTPASRDLPTAGEVVDGGLLLADGAQSHEDLHGVYPTSGGFGDATSGGVAVVSWGRARTRDHTAPSAGATVFFHPVYAPIAISPTLRPR